MTNRDLAVEKLRIWRYEPDGAVRFVRERFKAEPDPGQIEALIRYQKNQRTCMKASKGTGKTTALSWMCWHFMTVWDDCNIAATSITSDNLRDGLWKEMAVWQNVDPFLRAAFKWGKERIFSTDPRHEATWWMAARSWSKSANSQAQSDTLAGLHAKRIMFVLDETGGMPRPIVATAEAALATGEVCKIAQGGNPTNLEGPLYDACTTERALWEPIEMTGDPDNPKRSPRVSIEWAREQIQKYGRNSPWVKVNVFGEFPEASLNTLLGPDEVTAAMKRDYKPHQYNWAQKRLGVDVSRYGDDPTIIFPRQGLVAFPPATMMHERGSPVSVNIAARVLMGVQKWGSEMEFLDATGGWAAGARDILAAAGRAPISIIYNSPALDPRYVNRRAEMWITGSAWVKNGGALPNVPELVAEMTQCQYTYVNGKFQMEPKEHLKERIGRSPNYADALYQTFSIPDQPSSQGVLGHLTGNSRKAKTELDPYRDEVLNGD